jgi:hypothetical protein
MCIHSRKWDHFTNALPLVLPAITSFQNDSLAKFNMPFCVCTILIFLYLIQEKHSWFLMKQKRHCTGSYMNVLLSRLFKVKIIAMSRGKDSKIIEIATYFQGHGWVFNLGHLPPAIPCFPPVPLHSLFTCKLSHQLFFCSSPEQHWPEDSAWGHVTKC